MPWDAVRKFETTIAEWAGARYAVAVESGTAAIFLSLQYRAVRDEEVTIPKRTYPSVPCSIIHAGGRVRFSEKPWAGVYELEPLGIVDGALRFRAGMFQGGLHCLSFHAKKRLNIGRGGMILTDALVAAEKLRRMRFDGRAEVPLERDKLTTLGWNMYMQPEQASRGLMLFQALGGRDLPDLEVEAQGYPDLSQFPIYSQAPVTE